MGFVISMGKVYSIVNGKIVGGLEVDKIKFIKTVKSKLTIDEIKNMKMETM